MACTINLPRNQAGFNRIPASEDYATWETFYFFFSTHPADCRLRHGKDTPVHSGQRHCKERRAQADGIGGENGIYSWPSRPDGWTSTHAVCVFFVVVVRLCLPNNFERSCLSLNQRTFDWF